MKLKIFYSVQNGGDGSAYPRFMESKKLVEFDQSHMSEGWGESCTGSISFESESPITCLDDVVTKEEYLIEHYFDDDGGEEEKEEFIKEFFPNGLPLFTVKVEKTKDKQYVYNNVFVGEKRVAQIFRSGKDSGQVFEDLLNSVSN